MPSFQENSSDSIHKTRDISPKSIKTPHPFYLNKGGEDYAVVGGTALANKTEPRCIYTLKNSYANELQRIQTFTTSQQNRDLLLAFRNHLIAIGNSPKTVFKTCHTVRKFTELLNAELATTTIEQYETALARLERPSLRHNYHRHAKQFFRWYFKFDLRFEHFDMGVRHAARIFYHTINERRNYAPKFEADPGEIVTEEDLDHAIMHGCTTTQQCAFMATLHGTGARIEEHLLEQLKHVHVRGCYASPDSHVHVAGKTGPRLILLQPKTTSLLVAWLDVHPFKHEPEAFLWISESPNGLRNPLHYVGGVELIKRVFRRANIMKPCNPHWFRHSRATLWAPKFTTSVLCKLMGWKLDGRMIKHYVHLCIQDVQHEFKKIYST